MYLGEIANVLAAEMDLNDWAAADDMNKSLAKTLHPDSSLHPCGPASLAVPHMAHCLRIECTQPRHANPDQTFQPDHCMPLKVLVDDYSTPKKIETRDCCYFCLHHTTFLFSIPAMARSALRLFCGDAKLAIFLHHFLADIALLDLLP